MDGRTSHNTGAGRPMILVHGVGLDQSMWDQVIPLMTHDRHVVTYDLLGHGTTGDLPGERSLDDFSDQLLRVMDETCRESGSEELDVIGLSLGALIALQTATRRPTQIRKLVLANMVFGRSDAQREAVRARLELGTRDGMAPIAALAIDRWFAPDWQGAHADRVRAVQRCLETTDPVAYGKAYRVFAESEANTWTNLSHVAMPALAITGELDPGSTPAMTHTLAAALPACTAHILPDLHHLPAVEAPDQFAHALLTFLDTGDVS